jgi:uncharacterized membrane protein YesL
MTESMELFETRPYRIMERFTNLLLLNLAWAVACLPIVTAFPATAALFAVARDWNRGTDCSVFPCFIRHFRTDFWQSLWVGFFWTTTGAVLVLDFLITENLTSSLRLPLMVLVGSLMIAYVLTSVYLFPVMVSYRVGWTTLVKDSFLISVSQVHTTVLCLLVLAAVGVLAAYLPITLLVSASATAYAIFAICDHGIRRVEALKSSVG